MIGASKTGKFLYGLLVAAERLGSVEAGVLRSTDPCPRPQAEIWTAGRQEAAGHI